MNPKPVNVTMREETDPIENVKALARRDKFDRNYAWLEKHADEVFSHRGKYICIAGQQLFVGEDIKALLALARSAHPEDDGPLFQYVPKEKSARIYAHRWGLANL
jgi:hypothetical protein